MTNIEKLLAVQEYDLRIAEIERVLRDIPKRKDEEQTRLEKHKKALDEASNALKARQTEVKQLELEVDAHREKISKFRKQQLDIKTNKEFKAIELEIKAVEGKIHGFEDSELTLMEGIEAARTDVLQRQKELAQEESEIQEDVTRLDERAAGLHEDIRQNRELREVAARELADTEWLERYDVIRERRLNAVVKLEDGICSGCHMKLPPSAVHDVHKTGSITTCDYCGRLLY